MDVVPEITLFVGLTLSPVPYLWCKMRTYAPRPIRNIPQPLAPELFFILARYESWHGYSAFTDTFLWGIRKVAVPGVEYPHLCPLGNLLQHTYYRKSANRGPWAG